MAGTSMKQCIELASRLGALGGHKVHKSVKFWTWPGRPCHEAVVARASRPCLTGRYEGGSLLMASHLILPRAGNRRCTPIHADERRRTSACIRVHRRFQTTALVPFLLYQPCLGP